MAPLGANQDAKTTNGSGGLLSETAPMEMHPAPLTAGNMFVPIGGYCRSASSLVGAFLCLGGWFEPAETDAGAVRR